MSDFYFGAVGGSVVADESMQEVRCNRTWVALLVREIGADRKRNGAGGLNGLDAGELA